MSSGVGAVSGQCRGGVPVSVDTSVGVSGRCRTWCRGVSGFLDSAHVYAMSVGRVGVSGGVECRSVEQCRAYRACRVSRGVGRCVAVSGGVG